MVWVKFYGLHYRGIMIMQLAEVLETYGQFNCFSIIFKVQISSFRFEITQKYQKTHR